MPVNLVHSLIHRVEDGWDPIPPEHAEKWDRACSAAVDTRLVENLVSRAGGLAGKSVLDLGGGPGHYSVLFAQNGARVTWHDISRRYEQIARRRAINSGVSLEFSLGYLEDARKYGRNRFDLVFCRVCWYYGRSDRAIGKMIYELVKPGGIGYIESNTMAFSKLTGLRWWQHWFNTYCWWKIGHPMPPHGRIVKLIHKYPLAYLAADYSSADMDLITFVKSDNGLQQKVEGVVG